MADGMGARAGRARLLVEAVVFDAIDEVQAGYLAGDEYLRAAELRAQGAPGPDAEAERPGLAELIAEAPPEVLGRAMLAVAALPEDGPDGRCPVCAECRPRGWRWWRRSPGYPCPTRRVMVTELTAVTGPKFTAA
jgi:hypothetical protein